MCSAALKTPAPNSTFDAPTSMNLRSAALTAIVATLYASCIARSAATATIADPATAPDAIHSPNEAQYDGKRFLRTPVAEGNEEEARGGGNWFSFSSKLSGGAEKLDKKQLKSLIAKTLKDPEFYDALTMVDYGKRLIAFGAWKGLGVDNKLLAKMMTKAGYGGDDYKRFRTEYDTFLKSDIQL
ncbi:hypothetical protein PR002_g24748 [Phytophthora rubi]|uniref:RxLR effector protein n=1 Tax=Phytophthora rubi TaxID=129364 RepID=A0A6A3ID44_9STRA|nr:hypothetical protein PR002_g24748 [Phytophthora rubi]